MALDVQFDPVEPLQLPRENIAGHLGRLDWFAQHVRRDQRVLELGCGTGYMIALPMRLRGYDVIGVDLDEASVEYGRALFERAGLDPGALRPQDLADVEGSLDAIIASEVLEHLADADLENILGLIRAKLPPGGRLLVTVPNGYGWFELEAFLWFRTGIDRLFHRRRVNRIVSGARHVLTRGYVDAAHPSTVADSPHKQRFTLRGLERRLEAAGFEIRSHRGSVLVAGPFSHLAFTGVAPVMRLNAALGKRVPHLAAGFYVEAVVPA